MAAQPDYAFLADQQLYLVQGGNAPREIESHFVAQIHARREAARQRNQIRREGMAWNAGAFGAVDGDDPFEDLQNARPEFTGVAPGPSGEVIFALRNESVGGLFQLDTARQEERRLIHKQQMVLADLDTRADGGLVCSSRAPDGAAHLAVLNESGGGYRLVTEGDVVDEAPRWVPGGGQKIVYQTAGIGRDPSGVYLGLSPYAVHELDLDSGRMDVLLEQDRFDCLAPCRAADGSLYYIRRPYEFQRSLSPWRVLADVALFPFRLLRAGVHFLNAFSWMFSNKPLMTAGGPQRRGPEQRAVWLSGRWVEVRRNLQTVDGPGRPLVPGSWQLVRRNPNGEEHEVARSVVAFDLTPDGDVLYTDGSTIYLKPPGAPAEKISHGRLVQRIRVLPPARGEDASE